jgi:hypothetical protein
MKPRILVIVDVPGWALERTADNVMQRLARRYDFRKVFNTAAVQALSRRDYDLAYSAMSGSSRMRASLPECRGRQ